MHLRSSICLAISLFVINEYSFDRYNKNADQIVRLINTKDNSSQIDYRVKDILVKNYPEIQNACLALRSGHPVEVKCGEKGYYLDDIISVDNSFFEVFTCFLHFSAAITGFYRYQFRNNHRDNCQEIIRRQNRPWEKIFWSGADLPVTISGIIRDFPENSSLSAGLLVNAENIRFKFNQWIGDSRDSSTYRWPFQIYLQLEENVIPEHLSEKINENISMLKPYAEQVRFSEAEGYLSSRSDHRQRHKKR